jgi:hypothetical protein
MSHWEDHYTRGVLIQFDFDRHLGLASKVEAICREKLWQFATVEGDLGLLQAGLDGPWDADRFLVVEPGRTVRPSYDDGVLACGPGMCTVQAGRPQEPPS